VWFVVFEGVQHAAVVVRPVVVARLAELDELRADALEIADLAVDLFDLAARA
jgi:hypothetical protein